MAADPTPPVGPSEKKARTDQWSIRASRGNQPPGGAGGLRPGGFAPGVVAGVVAGVVPGFVGVVGVVFVVGGGGASPHTVTVIGVSKSTTLPLFGVIEM